MYTRLWMSNYAGRIAVRVILTVALLLLTAGSGRAEETGADLKAKEAKVKEAAVKKWKSMFGDNIDFAEEGLYGCMSYIHPQPDRLMVDLDDKKVIGTSIEFVLRDYFKPAYRFDWKKHEPDKYYLRKSEDEPSLLYYEWKTPKYVLRMYESGNGLLIRIKPKDYDPSKPLKAKALAAVLSEVIDLKYPSAEKIVEAFKLPSSLAPGTVFTNAKRVNIKLIGNWQKEVIGFVSKDDICILCFFSDGGRMNLIFEFTPR